jgi:hypothetical protein
MNKRSFERSGTEIGSEGLYVELGPWEWHFFQCRQPALTGESPADERR